ncbi:MAG: sensor histidine kinase [Vicinamibacteria bacterium]
MPRILVVDDDDLVRDTVRDILDAEGFEVAVARNGVEALRVLEGQAPDLVLSDVMMPEMDGHRFYEEVRARPEWLAVPFVFLTALGEKVDVRYAKALGVDDYLVKPVSRDDLMLAVRALLQRRARLEQAREQQILQVKEAMTVALAHELRTPLTYLAGYAELLQEARELKPEDLRTAIEGIARGTERLKRLAEDLGQLVALRSGEAQRRHLERRRRIDDPGALLGRALQRVSPLAASRGVELVEDAPPGLPPLLGDPDALTDAFARLVENAVKFSKPGGGEVRLRARAGNGRLRVELCDAGVGIRPEELERVLGLFYQSDRKRLEQQGTGCGLTIAHGVFMLHGGTLEIASQPGRGTTCSVELPALGPAAPVSGAPAA